MATFKSILQSLSTTEGTAYTVPSGKSAIVKMLQVSNSHTTTDYYVTVKVNNGSSDFYLAYQINVPARGAVALLSGDLYLQEGYSIKAVAQTGTYLHLVGSVVEL